MGRRYSKVLTVILIIIIIAVIGLLAYLGYNYYSKYRINKDSSDAVDAFIEEVSVENPSGSSGDNAGNSGDISTTPGSSDITTENSQGGSSSTTTKKKTYKGFNMLGVIEIPKTNIKYNVLEKVTKKSLETSVAVIYPFDNPVLNAPRNVVIVGHNYRNGVFFSDNKKLSNGDKIYITDLDGKKVTYIIYKIFETTETDTSFYNRDTGGKREITLSTCTDDATRRLIIQAREE